MNVKDIVKNLHPLERKVVPELGKASSLRELTEKTGLQQVEVMRALQWLSNKGILKIVDEEKNVVVLGKNGTHYKEKGLPEIIFFKTLSSSFMDANEVKKKSKLSDAEFGVSMGLLKRNNVIVVERKEGKLLVKKVSKSITFSEGDFLQKKFPIDFSSLKNEEKKVVENLRKRRDIVVVNKVKRKKIQLTELGKKLSKSKFEFGNISDKLTSSMLKSGSWKKKSFREYDVSINVPEVYGGKRHFVNQAVEYIRKIWLELGFEEMSGNMVQTSFWDLDALFVPQDHPARQMQDTFYIKDPEKGSLPKVAQKIKEVHENGGNTGSKGWGGKWSEEVAKENLLRTHTTVLSAQTLAKLSKDDLPKKFFAVGKVFRNEALDPHHLFEFYQVDGIVIDPKADMTHLKGYLREFFTKMGYKDVRIRPAHFPYTEPSAEVEVLHPLHNKWIELGGCGIFRPEVTKPLIGSEVPVLAWGLGMGRIISEYWKIKDIRELYKNDLKQMREMKSWMK